MWIKKWNSSLYIHANASLAMRAPLYVVCNRYGSLYEPVRYETRTEVEISLLCKAPVI